ncbi:M14 family metallopeptidase [Segetibacter sp.]|uniref:M14 family metallopeptidase n=1 Tax=Segetibacter sp. TaxID=2231182 RepID=UPI002625ACCA|nr:M14 family metallopeptidase [Segetibacter sp.]MCW3081720.1 zinc carboxypeptidase [Segetibacter sp.]
MKHLLVFVFSVAGFWANSQALQSPEQFLGYKMGTKFTPHYKIINYVRAVAQAMPHLVKLEKYGETYEGRELLLLYIANPDNLKNLDGIRQNNLAFAGLGAAKTAAATAGNPAIVWLSYNVHGNETSSSEAAMLTLFSLVDPTNTSTKEWLKNTVVMIDPCINPDGRDRYVNWFNSTLGQNYNTDPQSREHSEPWPGGRTNHYNFDLNRDWAWQTQKETQQRLVKYNQWLPQVHVDFHEQGINQPYYFAPAAEPFHEVITPWQREFQKVIGKNNAKYFDQNGWLFFTKERFDLLYPSYGDTYPLYNGAIGMTFEQGGGPRGGLAVTTGSGEVLTLVDRVTHHYTTGLSTIEMASQNAGRLVTEYKKFFDDSKEGKGSSVKTYILTSDNPAKINSVAQLLRLNGVEFGTVGNKRFKGLNYVSEKQETGNLKKYNLAVSTSQPKSVLARVLLEQKSKLADSVTYDITAWSLPFAYGVDAYAVSEAVAIVPYQPSVTIKPVASSTYGYLIPYNSIKSVKMLCQLLKQGVKVRFSERPFSYGNKQYDRGTLIVLQKSNPANLQSTLNELAARNEVEVDAVSSGFMDKGPDFGSSDVRSIRVPKVALLTGEQTSSLAAGEVWHLFEQQLDYPLTLINASDLGRTSLKNYNVLIVPDGTYRNLTDKIVTDKLKEFVSSGGTLIAMETAVQKLSSADWGIKLKEDKEDKKDDKVDYSVLKKYENRERDELKNSIPGAIYRVQLDNTHPLAFGYSDTYYTLKQDANVYEFLKEGWNVGVIKKDNYVTGFAGTKVKSQLKDGLLFGVLPMGTGSVVLLAEDPLFRLFWENGKMLFSNAVFLVGQ